jgi:putative tryptophan/tyrosine transport system substrate-binding protein
MKRRSFMALLGGAAGAWPVAVRGQQQSMPVIGYLSNGWPESDTVPVTAFRSGLGEIGLVEGQNVSVEYRWTQGQNDRLPALAVELVRRPVTVIAAIGGTPPALAAKAATSTIPIVFYVGVDPVRFGLVASLNRPSGNMTGVAALQAELTAKRIELLHELVPKAAVIALLSNPTNPFSESETSAAHDAARSLGLQLQVLLASTVRDIDAAFGTLVEVRAGALVVSLDQFFTNHIHQIVTLAARHAVPAIYGWREYAAAGGMVSYATNKPN